MLYFSKKFTVKANKPTKTLAPARRNGEKMFVVGHVCSSLQAKEGIKPG